MMPPTMHHVISISSVRRLAAQRMSASQPRDDDTEHGGLSGWLSNLGDVRLMRSEIGD